MRILSFIINCCFLFVVTIGFSQEKITTEVKKDTIIYKSGYGFRVGIDISKPALGIVDKSYSGLELVGDYRISKKWYLAAEIGHEEEITFEDFLKSTSKGNYIRLGANYNAYNNWLDMNNEIYVGGRYGFAIFDHTLNSYTPNTNSTYFPVATVTTPITENDLKGHWIEFLVGMKVETFKNLFIGFSGSYKIAVSINDQKNFKTLYVPGFNRVFSSDTGFGFNYTITYLIPFVNK